MKEESEMDKHITVPMKKETVATLKAGDYVYLTGTVYTARDAAHKRMAEALSVGQPLPIHMKNNIIYYRKAGNFQLIFKVR